MFPDLRRVCLRGHELVVVANEYEIVLPRRKRTLEWTMGSEILNRYDRSRNAARGKEDFKLIMMHDCSISSFPIRHSSRLSLQRGELLSAPNLKYVSF